MAANKSAKISSSIVSLPSELILEIFSRLPSDSIQRLRPILDDESGKYLNTYEFQHKHAFNVSNQPTNERLLITSSKITRISRDDLVHEIDPYPSMVMSSSSSDSSPSITRSYDPKHVFKDIIPHKMTANNYEFRIIGASNGLICLYFKFDLYVGRTGKRRRTIIYDTHHYLILWNPCTKELHALPIPQGFDLRLCYLSYHRPTKCGFGYDTANKTYKLVMAEDCTTQFYDLSTDSWKVIETIRIDWHYFNREVHHEPESTTRSGEYLNGSLHWIVSSIDIVSMDLSNEVSSLINLPRCCSNDHRLNLGVLKGCLYVSCYWSEGEKLNIWVMKEYGRVESWTNIATIILGSRKMYFKPRDLIYRPPLLISRDEKMLFAVRGQFACLFPMNEKFCYLEGLNFNEHCPGIVHVDTLVSPKPEVYGFCKDDDNNDNNKALVMERFG